MDVFISILHTKEISLERNYIDGPGYRDSNMKSKMLNPVQSGYKYTVWYTTSHYPFVLCNLGGFWWLSCYCCRLIMYYCHIYYPWSEMIHYTYRQLIEKKSHLFLRRGTQYAHIISINSVCTGWVLNAYIIIINAWNK